MMGIEVRVSVLGWHHWLGAPPEFEFLKISHMHEFRISVSLEVSHDDRQIEFLTARETLLAAMFAAWKNKTAASLDFGPMSCEMIAERISSLAEQCFDVIPVSVRVSEGDDGAGWWLR